MSTQCRPLIEVLAEIPDFRHSRGKRYPLQALLALACSAILCGYRSYSAIAEWGRNYGPQLMGALGFTHHQGPCAATLHTVFRHLDWELLEAKLGQWAESVLKATPGAPGESEGIALDGKTLRGSRKQGAPGAHLLSDLSHRLGLTLVQQAVGDNTNEIPVVREVLQGLVLTGRVFTMDALLTQREVAQEILAGGGDYLMVVKGNQPQLLEEIQGVFQERSGLVNTMATVERVELGHGRIEQRRLSASSALVGYSDWPGLQQVFKIERIVISKKGGKGREEVVYGITSLSGQRASPAHLLGLSRHHWHIENKSHWVRDVTFDEDRSQVRCGNIPQVMATLRNTAIGLMRWAGETNIAAACRHFAAQPWSALALIGIELEN
jgi:predicted transposase YbfD/YdcC